MNPSLVLRLSVLSPLLLAASLSLGVPARADAEAAMGMPAPAFRLQDQHEAWVSLADQKGKWVVLYFYPLDDSPGCTTEACEFRDSIFAFRKLGVNVLGVSVQDVASKKAFASKFSLPFPVLADTDKSVAKAYGIATDESKAAPRVTFIIDKSGRITYVNPKVNASNHAAEVRTALAELGK